jgi:hypothetical protein
MSNMTTLWVSQATKKRFNSFGVKGETDDQLLNWLMDQAEKAKARG